MSLIEVLVAILIIGIVLSFVTSGLLSNATLNNQNELRSAAAVAVRRVLDNTRAIDPSTLPGIGAASGVESVTVNNRTFTVYTDYCLQPLYCTTNARSIRVRARFGAGATTDLVSTDTVFTSVSSQSAAGS
ncbi:type IV pilus modification PilV family protein [Deinococcus rubellus]|uniref:Type II secretion system GspH family protein n=2 Tax=Deinococcus rubellus TaxID=1889240 RepID=A0ABY5YGM1_9DEIO|nr:type II secretion system protein [Deinococcus rubellus]UWX64230.1 type II secretion system GspH family protein [Deinococcus rubellus]